MKKLFFFLLFLQGLAYGQQGLSVATGVSVLRNTGQQQSFTTVGQGLNFQWHASPDFTTYLDLHYFLPGKFTNTYTAIARNAGTTPAFVKYRTQSEWRHLHISAGIKPYFYGSAGGAKSWNWYARAGVGLNLIKTTNSFPDPVDTSQYLLAAAPLSARASTIKPTVEGGIGAERELTEGIFIYSELRSWYTLGKLPPSISHGSTTILPVYIHLGLRFSLIR